MNKDRYEIFHRHSLKNAANIQKIVEPKAVFLTSGKFSETWIPALVGNPVVISYPGWLFSYGLDYAERMQDINEIHSLETLYKTAKKWHAGYILVSQDSPFRSLVALAAPEDVKRRFQIVWDASEGQILKIIDE